MLFWLNLVIELKNLVQIDQFGRTTFEAVQCFTYALVYIYNCVKEEM